MKKTRGMIEVVSITVYYFRCNVCGRYIYALTSNQARQYATVHLKTQHNTNAEIHVDEIELGRVVGGEDIFIRVPEKDGNYFVYITPEGRIWGQYCDVHGEKCDDGVDLDVKDVYQMLIKAFK